ncbi:MAG: hypothetical protein WD942_10175, partial [Dehalococcoidia bacterium]
MIFTVTPVVLLVVVASMAMSTRLRGDTSPEAVVMPPGAPRVVFAEFGLNEDRIYSAPADALNNRTLHATVPHAPGWGLNPAVAIAGALVAYTILPEDSAPDRGASAELWMLDITTQNLTRLARDADLLAPPVFVDDGTALVYRRSQGTAQELVRVSVTELTREVVHREQTSFGIFPLGTARGHDLLFTRISPEGTDLYSVHPDGAIERLFQLSEELARDWHVSPAGDAIAFLAPMFDGERAVHRARVVALDSSNDWTPPVPGEGTDTALSEQYAPIWSPDGSAITIGQEAPSGSQAAALLALDGAHELLPPPEAGFDVPLGWSADGRYLMARSFDGVNSNQPGIERTVLIDRTGARITLEVTSEVIF